MPVIRTAEEATEAAVTAFAIDLPAHDQMRASNELRKQGVFVSPSGVLSIWLRHNLASMKQRLLVLEKKAAEAGIIFTEAQVQALERKKQGDEACGEIETHHPGYLGSQDIFYAGTIKGVRRLYQQTFGEGPKTSMFQSTPPREGATHPGSIARHPGQVSIKTSSNTRPDFCTSPQNWATSPKPAASWAFREIPLIGIKQRETTALSPPACPNWK
jgi:hypothetical protein